MEKTPVMSVTIVATKQRPVWSDVIHVIHRCPDGPHTAADCNDNFGGIRPDVVSERYESKEAFIARLTDIAGKVWDRWQEANRE